MRWCIVVVVSGYAVRVVGRSASCTRGVFTPAGTLPEFDMDGRFWPSSRISLADAARAATSASCLSHTSATCWSSSVAAGGTRSSTRSWPANCARSSRGSLATVVCQPVDVDPRRGGVVARRSAYACVPSSPTARPPVHARSRRAQSPGVWAGRRIVASFLARTALCGEFCRFLSGLELLRRDLGDYKPSGGKERLRVLASALVTMLTATT